MAGEMIASVVVKEVVRKLGSGIWERFKLLRDFNQDLEDMKITLSTLQSVLKDAEKRSIREESVCLWLKELKAAAFDIEDMLNDIPAEDLPKKVPRFSFNSSPLISRNHFHLAPKMKEIRERLDKIAARRRYFEFLEEELASDMQEEINRRESTSEIDESIMYGRDKEKEIIVELLLDTNCKDNFSVIPIIGIGGLGKTTLAQLAFNDERVRVFDLQIWVYVSMEFGLKGIAKAILSEAGQRFGDDTLQSLSKRVKEILAGKRYLLVLDDIWSDKQDDWENLKNMLKGGKKGSKILVTTRSLEVASIMATIPPHRLKFLCEDDCWVLFKRRAFGSNGEQVNPILEPIGREIVRKCGGVPLVVNALGSMIRCMEGKKTWENVRDSELWKLKGKDETSEDKILSSLKLSYHHMPSRMKQCFAYCSVFPRGYEIDKDKLIQQWIGQGFIQTADWSLSLEVGNDYFNHLLSMSFFQDKKLYMKPGRVTYRMHDVIYDMAQSIAGDEVLVLDTGKRISDANWCRYVSVFGCDEIPKKQAALLERVRALYFRCCGFMELHYDIFSWTKCLRVLDLTGWFTDQLPISVYQLKQLRYLDMSHLPIQRLHESIGDLQNLQMLNLSYCSLEEIPKSIGKLQKLHILNLAGCSNLQTLPQSIGNLQNLVNLNLLECHDLQTLPESIGNLHNLVNLNLLECHKLQTLPESIKNLQNLVNLNLSYELRTLPEYIWNLQNLVNLQFSECHELQTLPESIRNLQNPMNLNLSNFYELRTLPKSIGNLQNLVNLNLSKCYKLQTLPESVGNLQNLVNLNLSECHELQTLPESIENFQNLVNLNISKCHKLQTLPESIGNIQNLINLNLSACDELQTLPESIGNLQNMENLNLSLCDELQTLPESIGNLHNLVNLRLSWCSKLQTLPEFIGNLQNLQDLKLSRCYRLQTLPESIGNLQNLVNLNLFRCLKLQTLPESIGNLQNLVNLELQLCRKLQTLSESIGNLQNLENLNLSGCYELQTLPESIGNLQNLVNLRLSCCCNLRTLPESIGNLQNLRDLDLRGCGDVQMLPESIGCLQKLCSLDLSYCTFIERLQDRETLINLMKSNGNLKVKH